MAKTLLFNLNIATFKRNQVAEVGDPAHPNLTDDYAAAMVRNGWADWFTEGETETETVEESVVETPVQTPTPKKEDKVEDAKLKVTVAEDSKPADDQDKQTRKRRRKNTNDQNKNDDDE